MQIQSNAASNGLDGFTRIEDIVCIEMLVRRNQVSSEILEQATSKKDVSKNDAEIYEFANRLIRVGFEKFKQESLQKYQANPWFTFAEMFLNTAKDQYFFAPSALQGQVINTLKGLPPLEQQNDSNKPKEWIFE